MSDHGLGRLFGVHAFPVGQCGAGQNIQTVAEQARQLLGANEDIGIEAERVLYRLFIQLHTATGCALPATGETSGAPSRGAGPFGWRSCGTGCRRLWLPVRSQ